MIKMIKKKDFWRDYKTFKKIKKSIIMTKTKKTNDESELSSVKSESSKKTSIRDDELERSVYSPDVANMRGIDVLE